MRFLHNHTLFLFTAAGLAIAGSAFGQAVAGLGAISGTVSDASGARVPGATVIVANPDLGIRRNLVSNDAGMFSATSLNPSGHYNVSVTKPGFVKWEQPDLELTVGQNLVIDAVIQVAGSAVQVDLVTSSVIVEQTKTDVSQTVN